MRSYAQAKRYAELQHVNPSRNWHNLCQMFARSCVGADAWAASARQAYNAIPAKYRHGGTPPAGALVYFGDPDSGYGHVIFMVENGKAWSNDLVRDGKIDLVDWRRPVAQWGLPYRGWTNWTPSGPIDLKSTVIVKPPKPSRHLLHLLHLAHIRAPLTDHQLHVIHVWLTEGKEIK